MKSQFESADHTRIRTVKKEFHKESLEYLKSGVIGRRLAEIIDQHREHSRIHTARIAHQDKKRNPINKAEPAPKSTRNSIGTPADAIVRLITGELNGSDRYMIRNIALNDSRSEKREPKLQKQIRDLLKRVRAAKGNIELPEEPQKNDRSPFTLQAIGEWLNQLGNIKIRTTQSETGLDFFASVEGCGLVCHKKTGGGYEYEIPGESAETALRNYFTAAVSVAHIKGPNGEKYVWDNRLLQFKEIVT